MTSLKAHTILITSFLSLGLAFYFKPVWLFYVIAGTMMFGGLALLYTILYEALMGRMNKPKRKSET